MNDRRYEEPMYGFVGEAHDLLGERSADSPDRLARIKSNPRGDSEQFGVVFFKRRILAEEKT
jgi:hypothetical protein